MDRDDGDGNKESPSQSRKGIGSDLPHVCKKPKLALKVLSYEWIDGHVSIW